MPYRETYRRSLDDPEGFWGEAARAIPGTKPWEKVSDRSRPPAYRWFAGGELNTCQNALDRHVEGVRAHRVSAEASLRGE